MREKGKREREKNKEREKERERYMIIYKIKRLNRVITLFERGFKQTPKTNIFIKKFSRIFYMIINNLDST